MKHLLSLLISLCHIICFTQTPIQKEKAKKLIFEYMQENLNDIKNYQAVSTIMFRDSSKYESSLEALKNQLNIQNINSELSSMQSLLDTKSDYYTKYDSLQVK